MNVTGNYFALLHNYPQVINSLQEKEVIRTWKFYLTNGAIMKSFLYWYLTVVFILLNSYTLNAGIISTTGTGGAWSATATWAGGVVPGSGDDVTIADGATVTVDANFSIQSLTIGQGVSGILQMTKTATITMTVAGNLLINAGGVFKVQSNTTGGTGVAHTLTLSGNLTSNGTITWRTGTSGTTLSVINLVLTGTVSSTLYAASGTSAQNGFNYITINKTGGAKITLLSNIITASGSSNGLAAANSGISFTSGIVETGNYILVCLSTTDAQISSYSSSSYVIGAFGRGMSSSAATSKNFPVGDAAAYRPFNLHSTTSGVASGHYAIVRCIAGNANTGSSVFTADAIDRVSAVRYYQVSYNNTGAGAASMSFDIFKPSYGTDDGIVAGNTDLRVAYSTDSRATWTMASQTTAHTTNFTAPPTFISPDALTTAIPLSAGGSSIFVALANVAGGTNNPLPVELTGFSARIMESSVELKWSTATEINNARFEIERSLAEGKKEWSRLGFVNGYGTSNAPKVYSFTDENVLLNGKFLYRLKQIDITGQFVYSKEITIDVKSTPKAFELAQNYPNPFNPTTSIKISVPVESLVKITVYNAIGKEVGIIADRMMSAGYQIINWNAAGAVSGLYYYTLDAKSLDGTAYYKTTKKMLLLK